MDLIRSARNRWVAGATIRSFSAIKNHEGLSLKARPDKLWAVLRDFSNISKWHPDVKDCVLEGGGPGDRVGATRAIHLQNGMAVREQVSAISDKDMSYSYSVVESPFPLSYHSSTVSLAPADDGTRTVATWYVEFSIPAGDGDQLARAIHQTVILPGFEGLRKLGSAKR